MGNTAKCMLNLLANLFIEAAWWTHCTEVQPWNWWEQGLLLLVVWNPENVLALPLSKAAVKHLEISCARWLIPHFENQNNFDIAVGSCIPVTLVDPISMWKGQVQLMSKNSVDHNRLLQHLHQWNEEWIWYLDPDRVVLCDLGYHVGKARDHIWESPISAGTIQMSSCGG
jgi:hypothetical protein